MKVPNSVEEKFLTQIFSPVFLFSKNPAKFSLVSSPSPPPSFDCLQYAKTEGACIQKLEVGKAWERGWQS